MNDDLWTTVDRYLSDLFVGPDKALEAALEAGAAAGLPSINVTPNQGKLLHLLARMQGARRILEVGTLGGYSTMQEITTGYDGLRRHGVQVVRDEAFEPTLPARPGGCTWCSPACRARSRASSGNSGRRCSTGTGTG